MINPYKNQTTMRQHDGMWIVNIGKLATVIADKCKEKALERAIKQHDDFVRNFGEFL
jgi:hypothetical protein